MLTRSAGDPSWLDHDVAGRPSERTPEPFSGNRGKQADQAAGPPSHHGLAKPSGKTRRTAFRRSNTAAKSFFHKSSSGVKTRADLRSRATQPSKARARGLKAATGNPPANALQRQVMLMVYDEITAYPPEGWCAIIGQLINRDPSQVNIWFGNQRQREAKARAEGEAFVKPPYSNCDSRRIRLRPSALNYFPETAWSDQLLGEIVMIERFRRHQILLLEEGERRAGP